MQNRDLSGKQSQILSRSLTMQAVLPVLQSGSRRPRSSPATPSAAPCSAPCARPPRHPRIRVPGRAARNFQQNRDLSGKQSQILSRSPTMQAALPVLQSGSRRPRSSPATPSAAPCGVRGSNKRKLSRGSRGLAPLQSGNFQDLTRVDCRILVTLDCKILVTAWAIRALHRRARA